MRITARIIACEVIYTWFQIIICISKAVFKNDEERQARCKIQN